VFVDQGGITGKLDEVFRVDGLARFEIEQRERPVDVAEEVRCPAIAEDLRNERRFEHNGLDFVLALPGQVRRETAFGQDDDVGGEFRLIGFPPLEIVQDHPVSERPDVGQGIPVFPVIDPLRSEPPGPVDQGGLVQFVEDRRDGRDAGPVLGLVDGVVFGRCLEFGFGGAHIRQPSRIFSRRRPGSS